MYAVARRDVSRKRQKEKNGREGGGGGREGGGGVADATKGNPRPQVAMPDTESRGGSTRIRYPDASCARNRMAALGGGQQSAQQDNMAVVVVVFSGGGGGGCWCWCWSA